MAEGVIVWHHQREPGSRGRDRTRNQEVREVVATSKKDGKREREKDQVREKDQDQLRTTASPELKEARRRSRAESEGLVAEAAWKMVLDPGDEGWPERIIAVDWIIRWDGRDRGLDDWLWTLRGMFVEKMRGGPR